MCIGGYAFNHYGFLRVTEDMYIWITPTEKNKTCFFNTMLCMGYIETEFSDIKDEDFTSYFMCTLIARPHAIDINEFSTLNIIKRYENKIPAEQGFMGSLNWNN